MVNCCGSERRGFEESLFGQIKTHQNLRRGNKIIKGFDDNSYSGELYSDV